METRKVQRLGPSTLAMTLPAEWASEHAVEKGDEVSLRTSGKGTLTVMPESANTEETEAIIHTDELDADAVERAIVAQYVLGGASSASSARTAPSSPITSTPSIRPRPS